MASVKKFYDPVIILLALFSVGLILMDGLEVIQIEEQPFRFLDIIILTIFAVDYFGRLYLSKEKWAFAKSNVFDLVAIIPFHSAFAIFRAARFFRIARLGRTTRLFRLTRMFGVIGKVTRNIKRFLHTNGFIYMVYACGVVIVVGVTVYSVAEEVNYIDSLWRAFVTSTTVGYGDISPVTNAGRIAAVFLMLTGIGLFGVLTSTITTFFTTDQEDEEIKVLTEKVDRLLLKLEELESKEEIK